MLVKDKMELKFDRIKEQFGCGYYSVCCRGDCPCSFKLQDYDNNVMDILKQEFTKKMEELFG